MVVELHPSIYILSNTVLIVDGSRYQEAPAVTARVGTVRENVKLSGVLDR